MTARMTDRVLIEQAVARGWGDERIALDLNLSIRAVVQARRALDELVDADAFAVIGVDTCAKGQPVHAGEHLSASRSVPLGRRSAAHAGTTVDAAGTG